MSTDVRSLPDEWIRVPIERLLAPLGDGRLLHQGWSPQCDKEPADSNEVWGVLKTTSVQAGAFLPEHNKRLPEPLTPRAQLEVREDDILITCAGPRARCGVACLVRRTRPRVMISGKMYRFRAEIATIAPPYLEAYLLSTEAQQAIDRMKTGISDSGLNLTHERFLRLPVPVAPRLEQERIVSEIEKQFTRIDAAVAALNRIKANLKRYRAAVLKAAVEGRLAATEAELARREGGSYETGDALLTRLAASGINIVAARGHGVAGRPAATHAGTFPEVPTGWTLAEVGPLLRERPCNGISVKASDAGRVPALRLNAMTEKGLDYTQIRHLPLEWKDVEDIEVKVGDFFVSRGSGSPTLVGRGTLAQPPPFRIIFPDTMIRLRFLRPVARTRWVPTIWPAQSLRRQIESRVKTTAGILKISQPDVLSLVVPLPPVVEQIRIVTEVERQFSIVDGIEAVVNASLKRAGSLRLSLLAMAFWGRLVPQDPCDEPASSVLDRIDVARSAVTKTETGSRKVARLGRKSAVGCPLAQES